MAIQAQLHDGRILEFPDGTDPSVIQSTVKKVLGAPEAPIAPVPAPIVAPAPTPVPAPVAAVPVAPIDNLDARLAAQEAKQAQFAPGEELKKGAIRAATSDLPSLWEQAGVMKDVGAALTVMQRMDLFDKIDKGEITDIDQLRGLDLTTGQGRMYLSSPPETRAKLKSRLTAELANRKDFVQASIDTINEYKKNAKKYAPRVEKASDIGSTADFTNFVASNIGSGAVQLVPLMLTAAATGGAGLFTTGALMGTSEAVGNRLQFLEKELAQLPQNQRADAVIKYLEKTGGTSLAVGIVSGGLDTVLGPSAKLIKQLASQTLKDQTRKEAVKAAVKETPKTIAGEGLTGGLQETAQIAGKVNVGERDKFATKQTLIDIGNAIAAEAAGSVAGAGANVGVAALRAPSAPKAEVRPEERIEPTMGEEPPVQPAPPAPPAPTTTPAPVTPVARAARVQELTDRMVGRGFDPEEAADAAELRVATEERELRAREEAAAAELPTYYPKIPKTQMSVEETLFREYLDAGMPPDQAREMAQEEAFRRKEDAKIAGQQARNIKKGKKDVAGLDTEPTGAGVPVVAERPPEVQPPAGLEGVERTGMVPPEPDAGRAVGREVAEPSALGVEAYLKNISDRNALLAKADALAAETDKIFDEFYSLPFSKQQDSPLRQRLDKLNAQHDEALAQVDALDAARTAAKAPTAKSTTVEAPTTEAATAATETDTAITEAQEVVAAPAEPKAKRGRKPYAEEKRAQTKEEQDKVEAVKTKADYELRKGKNSLTAMIDNATAPVNEELTAEEAEKAEADKRQDKIYAVRRLVQLSATPELRGTAAGKRINALLANRTKISQQEIDNAKRGIAVAEQALADKTDTLGSMVDVQGGTRTAPKSASQSKKGKPRKVNKRLTGEMTGGQALSVIAQTGTWFERLLANRLRKFVSNVRIVVLEKGQSLPAELADIDENPEGRWNGLFLPGTKPVVYVTGESFGALNGQNNITIMHELLHAALNGRLFAGMGGYSAAAKVFTDQIIRLMARAGDAYAQMDIDGTVPDALRARVESTLVRDEETGELAYEIFTSPDEFLSYALSETAMQDFLKSIPSVMAQRAASAFSDFVQSAAKVLGLGKGKDAEIEVNALTDLIEATDSLLDVQFKEGLLEAIDETLDGEALQSVPPEEQKPGQFSATAYKDVRTPTELTTDVKDALNKVKQSRTVEELADNAMLANIKANPKEFIPELMSLYNAADRLGKRLLLNFAPTDFLANEWGGSQIPRLKDVNRQLQEMHGMADKLMEGANKVSNVIFNEFSADSDLRTPTENLALAATLAEIDPSTDKRDPDMNKLWNALPEGGKKVYTTVRDFYEDLSAMHSKLLNDQIRNLDLTSAVKENLLTKIKAVYEVGDKIVPYFALARRGDYWLRVGSGTTRQFYMFTTPMQRDRGARAIAKQLREPVKSLEERGVFSAGNDISSQREAFGEDSKMLTELFDLIDDIDLSSLTPAQAEEAKKDIKDSVYQMYLIAMPDQNLRKQFIHRDGITGFSTDLMRNFSDSATGLSMQLSRIKYAPQIRNSMAAAQDYATGQVALEPFVEEMRDRVRLELSGGQGVSKLSAGAETVVNFLNRGAFVHYLSSASSAILQPISVIQFGVPILGARYGYPDMAIEFAKGLKVWNLYGISSTNADGSIEYTMPSMRNAPNITPLQRRALDAMFGRGIGTSTLTSDLLARGNVPAAKSLSMMRRYLGNAWWFGSGGMLMHGAERMSQELMGYMAFNLNQKKARKEFIKTLAYKNAPNKFEALRDFDNANFTKWVDRAVMDTYESLANMTQLNRPPLMRGLLGKSLTQFKMFGLNNVVLLGKNMKRMIAPLPDQTRTEAAKIFFGIMGTTILLGGASGLGITLTFLGFLSGMWKDWWEDEEKKRGNRPENLRDISFLDWFKATWLPNQIGGFIDKGTEEGKQTIDKLTALIARGGLNAATGADFSSRIGILDLTPRDSRDGRNFRESVSLTIEGFYPPTLSQGISYVEGVQLWMKGDSQRAFEKVAPASLRSLGMAYRMSEEGAKTTKGVTLQSADSITKGELVWRAIGFNSDKLADTQSTNYRMNQIEKNITNERTGILEKFKDADQRNDFDASLKAGKAANKFNRMYPSFPRITQETVANAVQGAREARGKSFKGVEISKQNAPFAVEAIAPSRRELIRAEQEAIKKKAP